MNVVDRLKEAQEYNAALEEKLQAATKETLSVEEKAAQTEQLLKQQEQRMKVRTSCTTELLIAILVLIIHACNKTHFRPVRVRAGDRHSAPEAA